MGSGIDYIETKGNTTLVCTGNTGSVCQAFSSMTEVTLLRRVLLCVVFADQKYKMYDRIKSTVVLN